MHITCTELCCHKHSSLLILQPYKQPQVAFSARSAATSTLLCSFCSHKYPSLLVLQPVRRPASQSLQPKQYKPAVNFKYKRYVSDTVDEFADGMQF